MNTKKKRVARAALDNIVLPSKTKRIQFSNFFLELSPNRLQTRNREDDPGEITTYEDFPDEEEYQPGFPQCQYYLEVDLGDIEPFDFEVAYDNVIWALDRLRLFKRGCLWGDVYGIFDPTEHPVGVYEFRRMADSGPMPSTDKSGQFEDIYSIQNNEIKRLVEFVDDLEWVTRRFLDIPLRRFHLSFDRDSQEDRIIDLIVALESMFSDDSEAITYKIALRVAHFMEAESEKREKIFNFVKKAYSIRSDIIHGRKEKKWISELTQDGKYTNLAFLEESVRRCLNVLLIESKSGRQLKSNDIDKYLFF